MTLSLVMGGAGFPGSRLVEALLAEGDSVIIADDLRAGSLANVEDSLRGGRARFLYLDVDQPVERVTAPILKASNLKSIGRIFHFASLTNLEALIELAIERRACLIYVSLNETDGEPLSNSEPEAGELAIAFAAARRGLDARIVRIVDCYGPRMAREDRSLIVSLGEEIVEGGPLSIPGDGLRRRSMTFVDDAIHLLLTIADSPRERLEPVYIGSDNKCTVFEIAETFARVAGVPFVFNYVPEDQDSSRRHLPAGDGARSMGYTPRTTLDDGLAAMIAWMRESAGAYA